MKKDHKRASHGKRIINCIYDWFFDQDACKFDVVHGLHTSLALGAAICLLFICSDKALLHDSNYDFNVCLAFRIIMIGMCFCYVAFAHKKFFDGTEEKKNEARTNQPKLRFYSVTGLLIVHLLSFLTGVIGIIVGGSESNYFAGVIMIFVGIGILVPLKPSFFAFNVAIMTGFYYVCLVYDERAVIPSVPALSNLVMVISGATISWFCCASIAEIKAAHHNDSKAVENQQAHATVSLGNGENDHANEAISQKNIVNQVGETDEDKKEWHQQIQNLIKLGGVIIVPMLGLFMTAYIGGGVADRHLSIPAVNIIGPGAGDEMIEFRNTARLPITLETAQVVVQYNHRDYSFQIQGKNASEKIEPGETWRIYTHDGKNDVIEGGQYIETSNVGLDLSKVNLKAIRIWGFHVKVD